MTKEKLSKSDILKQKYGFDRNKDSDTDTDIEDLGNKILTKHIKEYAHNIRTSKKRY